MTSSSETPPPLLEAIATPADLRALPESSLQSVANELRQQVITSVAATGGHLGASLGVVELTVALHYVFNTPDDRLIWDVGHQCYPHKILTGRRDRMLTLRQGGGLSGFPRRSESPYDAFGTAHSSTSISAGLGMAVASDLLEQKRHVISVIGDGAMSAGMAYEAMNNAGYLKHPLIVILNDNDMSIAPPVGAMSAYLSRLISSRPYHRLRALAKGVMQHFPRSVEKWARRAEEYARGIMTGGTLFEELGFFYIGPIDGHNLDHLLPVLKNVRDHHDSSPVLIHVVTQKGRGYAPAEAAPDKLHATATFDHRSGAPLKTATASPPTYTQVFAESLIREAEHDDTLVAITAAMPSGTGLDLFGQKFPDRCFDVGIAEQHAVTFAAGLATEGLKPFVALYSTFLQRAYDQVIHDVALQNLPVRFVVDRAGLVGADGASHAGSFDLAYLGCLPNMVIMAPSDEAELSRMVATARTLEDGPSAIRFPRGTGPGTAWRDAAAPLLVGRGRVVRQGHHAAILSCGARLSACLKAAERLTEQGIEVTIADARFMKPLDTDLLMQLARHHPLLLLVEEGSIGGFASHALHTLAEHGALEHGLKVRSLILPDAFLDQDTPEQQYHQAGLSADPIAECVSLNLGLKTLAKLR